MNEKNHYRKVFKSDHLGIADLEDFIEEGKKLVFTIKDVKQEYNTLVAGRKINANIAYFKEDIKPMVLNATNSKVIKSFIKDKSPFVEDWKNITIELYIDSSVKMKGEIVGGVRIRPKQPITQKPELLPNTKPWNAAILWLQGDGSIPGIRVKYFLSEENEQKLKDAVTI